MSDLSKRTVSKEELEKLRKEWVDAQVKDPFAFSPNYMVLVSRVVRYHKSSHLVSDTYLFGGEIAARACYSYFHARGGVSTLALVYVMSELGYTVEPDLHGGP